MHPRTTPKNKVERIIFLYKILKNNSTPNIAELTGIPKGTVDGIITKHINGVKGFEFDCVIVESKMNYL